ncbi:hypothetical protein [Streptomyces sp. LKA04]
MGAELILGYALGVITPAAVKKTIDKVKPWLRKKLRGLLEDDD